MLNNRSSKRIRAWLLLRECAVAALILFLGVSVVEAQELPAFELKSVDGETAKLSYTEGVVGFELDSLRQSPNAVFIHFFQPDCNACRAQMQALESIHKDYTDKGVLVLGVAHRGGTEEIRDARIQTGVSYPLLEGTGSAVALKFARGDASIIFDANGTIQFSQLGFKESDIRVWQKNLDSLISGTEVAAKSVERGRLAVGDILPPIYLPALSGGDTISLTVEQGKLVFKSDNQGIQYPKAAVGMFSRF